MCRRKRGRGMAQQDGLIHRHPHTHMHTGTYLGRHPFRSVVGDLKSAFLWLVPHHLA